MNIKHLFINSLYGLLCWAVMIICVWFVVQEIRETEPKPALTVSQCLVRAQSKEALELCLPAIVSDQEYDFYLRRYDSLLWKNEAY
jgi:TRAP-type C4-dicarboxylate transport system permease large subunit